MEDLLSYLTQKGYLTFEPGSHDISQQQHLLSKILSLLPPSLNCMEIGFNSGSSALLFLSNPNVATLTSFDLGAHSYGSWAKSYIDMTFPFRHRLILGDSRETVPALSEKETSTRYDVIFIDGGHDYEIARADLRNCSAFAHRGEQNKKTLVIVDDVVKNPEGQMEWTLGPSRAWKEACESGLVQEIDSIDFPYRGRGMAWGFYV